MSDGFGSDEFQGIRNTGREINLITGTIVDTAYNIHVNLGRDSSNLFMKQFSQGI